MWGVGAGDQDNALENREIRDTTDTITIEKKVFVEKVFLQLIESVVSIIIMVSVGYITTNNSMEL